MVIFSEFVIVTVIVIVIAAITLLGKGQTQRSASVLSLHMPGSVVFGCDTIALIVIVFVQTGEGQTQRSADVCVIFAYAGEWCYLC